jgi:hypothetical protein
MSETIGSLLKEQARINAALCGLLGVGATIVSAPDVDVRRFPPSGRVKRTKSGRVAPVKATKRKRARTGEMTKWVADVRARRVPTFVIKATGLKTKKAIVAKFGKNAHFAVGGALPKALARIGPKGRVNGQKKAAVAAAS